MHTRQLEFHTVDVFPTLMSSIYVVLPLGKSFYPIARFIRLYWCYHYRRTCWEVLTMLCAYTYETTLIPTSNIFLNYYAIIHSFTLLILAFLFLHDKNKPLRINPYLNKWRSILLCKSCKIKKWIWIQVRSQLTVDTSSTTWKFTCKHWWKHISNSICWITTLDATWF